MDLLLADLRTNLLQAHDKMRIQAKHRRGKEYNKNVLLTPHTPPPLEKERDKIKRSGKKTGTVAGQSFN